MMVALVLPATAVAECAESRDFLEPPGGGLPPKAVLHLFAPYYAKEKPSIEVRDSASGRLLSIVVELVDSHAFRVWRISFDAGLTSRVTVSRRVGERDSTESVTYDVESAARREDRAPVRVESFSESYYFWTCSAQALQRLSVDVVAPVYRIEWAATEAEFLRGRRDSFLLPHRTDLRSWRPDSSARPQLDIGYLNCLGATHDWSSTVAWLSVVAVFPDGGETPLGRPVAIPRPSHFTEDPMRVDLELDWMDLLDAKPQPAEAPNLDYVREGRGVAGTR